jgi:colanic acid/amylovoran biosynthesis glycosyltransferase
LVYLEHPSVRVAYFTNNYPGFSHTFIRREIRAMEALGVTVFRYALRPGKSLVDREDKEEERQTRYIVGAGASEMLRCWVAILLTRPLGLGQAIRQAVKIGWHSDRGILRHLVYVPEAAILAHWCRQNGIQHLHAHFGTNSAAIAMLAWRIAGIPYSFTAHGPEEFDKWPFLGLAEKIRHCKFVVAVSSFGRSQLYRCVEHEHWNKVQVVHCGLESAVFAAANTPTTAVRRLVCVGRLSEQKGHLLLVEAARRLATQGVDFELVLIGDGQIRADIEALVRRHNLQARVRITGWLEDRQVWEEILAARALVLPSFAEGLPVVIMEAMALRRPVISTFVAGIPELVHSGEHGWLVPAGDVEALVDAMRACLDAPIETLARMGQAAQKRVLLRHSVDTEVAKLAKLFEAAIIEERARDQH